MAQNRAKGVGKEKLLRVGVAVAATVVAKMWGHICGEEHCTREGGEERPVRGLGPGRREARLLLCPEHAEQASAGGILSAVALDCEWRHGMRVG
jgi:hypothetical protein